MRSYMDTGDVPKDVKGDLLKENYVKGEKLCGYCNSINCLSYCPYAYNPKMRKRKQILRENLVPLNLTQEVKKE